jgi:phosphatidylglycerol lysyltransferase
MQKLLKRALPLVWLSFAAAAAWVLIDRIEAIRLADIVRHLGAVPPSVVIGALACSAAVYASIGVYEGRAVRLASGRKMFWHAFRTALTANPIGRAVGVAMVSSGALRYRMYAPEGLSIRQVGAVVVLMTMPYIFGVGWLIDLSLLFHVREASTALQLPATTVVVFGILGLAKDCGWLAFVALRTKPLSLRGQEIKLPPLRHALMQIAFGLVQISLMSTILYLFMPPELNLSWPAFIAIYCIAFVAGQLSNVPVGLGVLEAALLLMLPQVPPAKLLSSVLAYRAVYEIAPLLIALVLLVIYESTNAAGAIRRRFSDTGDTGRNF